MKRILFICTFLGCFFCTVKAQISTEEQPYSWGKGEIAVVSIPVISLPSLDLEKLAKEDAVNEGLAVPFRFGFPHEVNLSLSNSGVWKTTADGSRLWTLRIYSPDALSLNLLYDDFWLPEAPSFFYMPPICKNIWAHLPRKIIMEIKKTTKALPPVFYLQTIWY